MMKNFTLLLLPVIVLFFSCKSDTKKDPNKEATEYSIPEKIAMAHGIGNWDKVNKIEFTFNVDRDTTHFERSWVWDKVNNTVTRITDSDTTSYHRNEIDSISAKVDAGFINDKYWLLAPFNLKWDKDAFTYNHSTAQNAPISKTPMQKLTIVYGNKGGYTPGDAYDFYFGEDFLIKEWVFRKENQKDASLVTTWEDYEKFNELHISKMHKKEDGSFSLFFTDIKVN